MIKFCHDPREVSQGSTISAELFEDGTGMLVKEPLIPAYFLHNIVELSNDGSDKEGWGGTRKRDYNKKMKEYHASANQSRTTTINFPAGIVGTNEFIGHKKKSSRKHIELRRFSNSFQMWTSLSTVDQLFPMYYAFWKIGIKGTMDDLSLAKQANEEVDDACSGLERLTMNQKNFGTK